MARKPTYEELEQRVNELEKKVNGQGQLEERLRLLSLAIEQSSEGIAVSDLDGNLKYLNPAFAHMHGYSPDELFGTNLSIFHTPEQMPSVEAAKRQIQKIGDFKGEIWHAKRDGTVFPAAMHNSIVLDDVGSPIGMSGTLRDISDMKKAEERLRESEEKYRKLVQDSLDGIFIVEGVEIKFANRAALDMFGYRREEEMVGRPMIDMISPEYRELMVKRGEAREKGQDIPNRYEFQALRKDGTEFTAELSVSKIDFKGRVARQGVVRDISEKKRAEEALRASKNRFKHFLDNLGDLVYEVDCSGNITYTNKMGEKIAGVPLKNIIGKPFIPFVQKESQELAIDVFQRTLNGESPRYELTFATGEICHFKNEPLKDDTGNIIGVFGIARDITELKLMDKALLRANEELELKVRERTKKLLEANEEMEKEIEERKHAEKALRESEKKFRFLAETLPVGIDIHRGSHFIYNNPALTAITGYTDAELKEMNFWDFVHPDFQRTAKERGLARQRDGSVSNHYEMKILTKEGEERWIFFAGSPVEYQGQPAVLGTILDVTEHKHAEKALRESEERYRLFVQNFPGIAFQGNLNYVPIFFHGAVEEITGYTENELLSEKPRWDKIIHPDDLNKFRDDGKKIISTSNYHIEREYRIIRKDGQISWIHEFIKNICDNSGTPIHVEGALYDVTDRVEAIEALRESEEKYRLLVETMNDGLGITDNNNIFEYANDKMCQMMGYSREEMIGRTLLEFLNKKNKNIMKKHLLKRRNGEKTAYELSWTRKGGRQTPTITSGSPIFDTEGNLKGGFAVLTDISKLKKVQLQLKKREKELEIKSSNLEEANTALKVLLKKRDEDRIELEEKVMFNVKELIDPYIDKLRKSDLDKKQITYVDILYSNFNDIISPFSRNLSRKYLNFTPKELEIANLVKQGFTTKEIAKLFAVSKKTIDVHRDNIRKKIGIKNKKANLRTHLLAFH